MIVYKTIDARTRCPALLTPCIKELGGDIDYAYAGIFASEEEREQFIADNKCVVRDWAQV